ncbi:unnamed protein product, partial [Rotaria socialis]
DPYISHGYNHDRDQVARDLDMTVTRDRGHPDL